MKDLHAIEVYVVGLALDYCVGSTALDAQKLGFKTSIIMEGTRPVANESKIVMMEKLKAAGVECISVDSVLK